MTARLVQLVLALCLAVAVAAPLCAETASPQRPVITIDKRKLLVPPKNADGTVEITPFLEDPVLWLRGEQQAFYSAMSGAMRNIRSTAPAAAALTLLALSFAYGVLHAAGPGHGKAVISAWLLATESQLRRGILIAFLSAIIQGLTAVTIVSVLMIAAAGAGAAARDVAGVLESTSYAMIGATGLYLIATAFRRTARPEPAPAVALGPFADFTPLASPDHVHGPGCGCGHAHLPEARGVTGDWSLAKAFSLALAVGIRPCSGAILVLVFANAMGLYWAGVASTFAMALGTFITVSAIAMFAVHAKVLAERLASRDTRWLGYLSFGLRLGAGSLIVVLGALLFFGSLGADSAMS